MNVFILSDKYIDQSTQNRYTLIQFLSILPIQTVCSPQIIILYVMSQQKIYTKREIAYKKQILEHNFVLQESCTTVRRWQRFILLVKVGHCVGDQSTLYSTLHLSQHLLSDHYLNFYLNILYLADFQIKHDNTRILEVIHNIRCTLFHVFCKRLNL